MPRGTASFCIMVKFNDPGCGDKIYTVTSLTRTRDNWLLVVYGVGHVYLPVDSVKTIIIEDC